MALLTLVVWLFMYARRLQFIWTSNINPEELTSPERRAQLIPETVNYAAYNFTNLLELPVLFYAFCLYLYVTQSVDQTYLAAAWFFVGFRALHSSIHCTVNKVSLRFLCYVMSAFALWFILARIAVQFWTT